MSEGGSAPRDLHPQGTAILSRWGLLFPLKPSAEKWWAWRDLHPGAAGQPDSDSGPSAIRVEPHARKMELPAGLSPATSAFEARCSNNLSYGSNGLKGGPQKAEDALSDDAQPTSPLFW